MIDGEHQVRTVRPFGTLNRQLHQVPAVTATACFRNDPNVNDFHSGLQRHVRKQHYANRVIVYFRGQPERGIVNARVAMTQHDLLHGPESV